MFKEFEITSYKDESGKDYFSLWFSRLDAKLQNIVIARFNRVKLGNFGDYKFLGDGFMNLGFIYQLVIEFIFQKKKIA
jgi:putative component of toxin-antitoxin plasmid stabilization module